MIPTKKKIAILHPYVNKKGGAVSMMIFLGNLLEKYGNFVSFYTNKYDAKLFMNDINFPIYVDIKIKIAYRIRKYDYIFVGNSPMQFVAGLSKMLFSSKAQIFWWHHHYPWYFKENANVFIFFKGILEKFFLRYIDKIVANSLYIQKVLENIYGQKPFLLYPIIDSEFKKKDFVDKTNLYPKIISYGRWEKGKNLEQIFQTYETLLKKIPNLELQIGGVGTELTKYIKSYKKRKGVQFLGLLGKTRVTYLNNSTLFLFPSQIDSFGISAVEALSQGVPVIGFSGKGLDEVIQNGKNGFLVSSSDEFTEKTFEILQHRNYISFCESARQTGQQFLPDSFLKNLEKIF